jgi:hypothetical protein
MQFYSEPELTPPSESLWREASASEANRFPMKSPSLAFIDGKSHISSESIMPNSPVERMPSATIDAAPGVDGHRFWESVAE